MCASPFKHVKLIDDAGVSFVTELFPHFRIGKAVDGDGDAICAADGALEKMDAFA